MPRCCCSCYNLLRRSSSNKNRSNNKKQHSFSMRTAPKQVDYISVIYNKFLYAYMPQHMLQLIEILRSITNGPYSDIPDILNKYFARSTYTIFIFPSLI